MDNPVFKTRNWKVHAGLLGAVKRKVRAARWSPNACFKVEAVCIFTLTHREYSRHCKALGRSNRYARVAAKKTMNAYLSNAYPHGYPDGKDESWYLGKTYR